MDRDTIIRLAREAGFEILDFGDEQEVGCGDGYHIQTDLIERFAALVAAQEREANEAFAKRQEWWNDKMVRLEAINAELVEALRWYVDTDEVMEMEGNEFWLDGRERARAALAKWEARK